MTNFSITGVARLSEQANQFEEEDRVKREAERIQATLKEKEALSKLALEEATAYQRDAARSVDDSAQKASEIIQRMMTRMQERYTQSRFDALLQAQKQLETLSNRIAQDIRPFEGEFLSKMTAQQQYLNTALKTGQITPQQVVQYYLSGALNTPKAATTDQKETAVKTVSKADIISLGAQETQVTTLASMGKAIIATAKKNKLKSVIKDAIVSSMLTHIGSDAVSDQVTAKVVQAAYLGIVNQLKQSRQFGDTSVIDTIYQEAVEDAKSDISYALRVYYLDSGDAEQLSAMQDKAVALGMPREKRDNQDVSSALSYEMHSEIDTHDLGSLLFDSSSDNSEKKHKDTAYTASGTDAVILDRIRAGFMQLAISGFFHSLRTRVRLFQDEKAAIRLGIYTDDMAKQLKKDGIKQAIERLHQILDEALFEQASFHTLSGPDYDTNKAKIAAVIENLRRLNAPVSDKALHARQRKATAAIMPVIELEQLHVTRLILDDKTPVSIRQALEKRLVQLDAVKSRLELHTIGQLSNFNYTDGVQAVHELKHRVLLTG